MWRHVAWCHVLHDAPQGVEVESDCGSCRLAGSRFDAWVYIVGSRTEPAGRTREESRELRHDKALLKGLMKRSRLPLTIIHNTVDLEPAACKVREQIVETPGPSMPS